VRGGVRNGCAVRRGVRNGCAVRRRGWERLRREVFPTEYNGGNTEYNRGGRGRGVGNGCAVRRRG